MKLIRNILLGIFTVLVLAVVVGLFWIRDRYVVPILTYHHVSDTKDGFNYLNHISPEKFAWQMKFIAKYHYNVISFDDYIQGLKRGAAFARNTVVIQFDDGYDDNYTHAFPILKQHEFPAMIFLVSGKIGQPGFLTWDQVKEMERFNVKAGAHTRWHPFLPEISLDEAKQEIEGSKKDIEAKLGHAIDYFVYPSGGFTEEVQGVLKEAGYVAACTTNRGRDRFNRNLFEINRIRVKESETAFTLWAKLSGYYNLFRSSKYSKQSTHTDPITN